MRSPRQPVGHASARRAPRRGSRVRGRDDASGPAPRGGRGTGRARARPPAWPEPMILLCGDLADSALSVVQARLRDARMRFVAFDQRDVVDAALEYRVDGEVVTGRLRVRGAVHPLEAFSGIYLRLAEPDGRAAAPPSQLANMYDVLLAWCQVSPARVVTRP